MCKILLLYLLIFVILLIYTIFSIKKESFVKREYTLSYFDLNPLQIYVSQPEAYIDDKYFEFVFKKIPHVITYDTSKKYNSDLALLPESDILFSGVNGDYVYDYLCKIQSISFSFVQNEDSSLLSSFRELDGKKLAIIRGGYVEKEWRKVINYYNFENKPTFVYYQTDEEIENLLRNRFVDGMASLAPHPNATIFYLSTVLKIRILSWKEDEEFQDVLMYKLKGLKKTEINLKYYSSYIYNFGVSHNSYGYDLALFIKKNMDIEPVYKLTELTYKNNNNYIRPAALVLSNYIPIHRGTRNWLIDNGYLRIDSQSSNKEHCFLLAGKAPCEGELETTARNFYERDYYYEDSKPKEQDAIRYLKDIKNKTQVPYYGKYYMNDILNSYQCIDHPYIRNKEDCEALSSIWDRPCLKDSECPFFQANQNYENNFGKCESGFCEMPLNVVRKGFRSFDSKPICHPAQRKEGIFDCNVIKNMASPDYAFKNDRSKRLQNKDELQKRGINI